MWVLFMFIVRLAESREAAEAVMWVGLLPFTLLLLGAFVYSIVKTSQLEPPRTAETTLTLLLFPGLAVPILGLLTYLVFSIYIYALHRAETGIVRQ